MSETIRTFVAIELETVIQDRFKEIQDDINALDVAVRWVKPKNIHLTLKFLGNVDDKKLTKIVGVFPSIFENYIAFDITIDHLGAFPKPERPRIIWAGVNNNSSKVTEIANSVENGLGNLGFKKELKEFVPHITIGRVKSPKNLSLLSDRLKDLKIPQDIKQRIKKIVLFKSTLSPQGSIYEPLTSHTLE